MSETPLADLFEKTRASGATNEQIVAAVRCLEITLNQRPRRATTGERRRQWDRARKANLPANWAAITQAVFKRDGYCCTYCGDEPGDLHCDHIIPLSRGGSSEMENLTAACMTCNLDKGSKLLSEWHFYQEYVLWVTGP